MEILNIIKIFLIYFLFLYYKISLKLNHYDKVYITITSWKARINKIHKTLEILLNNSIKPKKLILNLSTEEFPNKKYDLPKNILKLL